MAGNGQGEIRMPRQQPLEGDLRFQTGELQAQADVNTGSEGDMRIGAAVDVESFRLDEHFGIGVRRPPTSPA